MESREEIDESGTEPKFFKTEISQNTDGNRRNFAYDDFARLEVERNTSTKAKHCPKRQKTPEKFGPDISAVHMRRTPTPSDGTRKQQGTEQTSDKSLLQFLSMRKIARQVRNLQINRQHRLDYTGNETIEHKVRKFKPEEVEPILFKFLKDNLECSSYDSQECRELSKELSEELKDVVKSMKYPRYKFVSMVTIGPKEKQAITISSRSLINKDMDTHASVYYTNGSLFAVAMIFATFFE